MCNCEKTYKIVYEDGRRGGKRVEISFKAPNAETAKKLTNKKLFNKKFRIISITEIS